MTAVDAGQGRCRSDRAHGFRSHRRPARLPGDRAAVRARRRWCRMRATGTRTRSFRSTTLRKAAALGFGGIYVEGRRRRLGAVAARRHAHLRGTGAGLHLDRGLYLDPQHGGLDDRRLRRRRAAPAIPAEALHHGAFRELLPDRAGRRLGRREPEDARACATATTTCSTAPRRSSPAAASPTSTSAWCAPAGRGRRAFPASWSRRARRGCRSARRRRSSAGSRSRPRW